MADIYKDGFVRDGATGALTVLGPGGAAIGGASAPLSLVGSTDAVQLSVKGTAAQTNPIFLVEDSTGADLFKVMDDETIHMKAWVFDPSVSGNELVISGGSGPITLTGSVKINGNVGFYNTTPIAKPTVSGSRGGNAALADLLVELAALGLITNSTTA